MATEPPRSLARDPRRRPRGRGRPGLDNLRYEEGSVYELPFSEASFDVAYAQQVFQHLGEPSPMGEGAVEYGYASRSELEAMAAAAHPDALWAFVNVEALARKPA